MQRPRRHLGGANRELRHCRESRQAGCPGGAQERYRPCCIRVPAGRRAPATGHGNGGRRTEAEAVPRRSSDRDSGARLWIDRDPVMTPRKIEPSAIIPLPQYAGQRAERRKRIAELKKNRRLEVGPFATFYFECYDTMLHQVHEMLFIEKGGAEQLPDELAAYNPLIPQGAELVATVMFEIDDPLRRARVLAN